MPEFPNYLLKPDQSLGLSCNASFECFQKQIIFIIPIKQEGKRQKKSSLTHNWYLVVALALQLKEWEVWDLLLQW